MMVKTLHITKTFRKDPVEKFEKARKQYMKDLLKLRKKYQGTLASLALDYGESTGLAIK